MWEDSPLSEKVFQHFNTRFGQMLAPLGLLKVLSIYSSRSEFPRLPVMHEARSREFKGLTMRVAMRMFTKDWTIPIEGEKTIHCMEKDYGDDWDGKCVCVDDANTMFSDMAMRTRQRWLSAFSMLISGKKYEYGDKVNGSFTITGRISLLINLAAPSYSMHKNELSNTTLGNRLFIVHRWLPIAENRECKKNFTETMGLKPKFLKIEEHYNRRVRNFSDYEGRVEQLADDYSALAVRSPSECQDIITAIVRENARLNERNYVCDDDIMLVRMLRPYNKDPMMPDKPRVVEFLRQERSFSDIIKLLGKSRSYYPTLSRIKKEAKEKGAID